MRGAITVVTIGLVGVVGAGGCVDRTPPPGNVEVPLGPDSGPRRSEDRIKPMPEPADGEYGGGGELPPPPFNDVPLVSQETPEQEVFVQAYEGVGRPRIVVFVNRTLEGRLLPVNDGDPLVSVERNRTSRGDVSVESRNRQSSDDLRSREDRDTTERFESRGGPGEYRDRLDVYLRPGQYDEVSARQVDYEAIENVLTDVLAAGGRTEIVSPVAARRKLTAEQVKELSDGERRGMNEVVRTLDADVLVHVTARPTRQTSRGLHVRLVAEAINAEGGQSIGRAVVDMPPPLDKPRINKFTRFLARKLMDGMIGTWESLPPDRGEGRDPARTGDDRDRGLVPERDRDAERGASTDRLRARSAVPPAAPAPAAPIAADRPATAPNDEAPLLEGLDEPGDASTTPPSAPVPDARSDDPAANQVDRAPDPDPDPAPNK